MIRVFAAPEMKYTPLQSPAGLKTLAQAGIELAAADGDARVVVSNTAQTLAPFARRHGKAKHYLLWTHEPRFHTGDQRWIRIHDDIPARVMNLYTGESLLDNYYFADGCGDVRPFRGRLANPPPLENRKIAFIAGYVNAPGELRIGGSNIDLIHLRQKIALLGHRRGVVDIYGRGWPAGISREDSRGGAWPRRKLAILSGNYYFNLCLENTQAAFYCSEKIWDSIRSGCLPIYYGTASIHQDFPKDSFIDCARFADGDRLFDYLLAMPAGEFMERYNRCFAVSERAQPLAAKSRDNTARRLAQVIRELATASP